ncbi:MAG: hypothetical protein WCB96_12990 [Candidatus Aminicenantales bacterium]
MKKHGQDERKNKQRSTAYRPKPPFGIIEGIGTPAFDRLSPTAVWALVRLYSKFNGLNRSNLSLPYRGVKRIMSPFILTRSIWELLGFGFIDVQRWGRLEKNCSIYSISDRWRRWQGPDSKPHLDRIAAVLAEIEKLRREKWPDERKSEKRQHIVALRKTVFDVKP